MGKNEEKKFVRTSCVAVSSLCLVVYLYRVFRCVSQLSFYVFAHKGISLIGWKLLPFVCVYIFVFFSCFFFFIFDKIQVDFIRYSFSFCVFFFSFSKKKTFVHNISFDICFLFFLLRHIFGNFGYLFIATLEKVIDFLLLLKAHFTSNFHYNSISVYNLVIPKNPFCTNGWMPSYLFWLHTHARTHTQNY